MEVQVLSTAQHLKGSIMYILVKVQPMDGFEREPDDDLRGVGDSVYEDKDVAESEAELKTGKRESSWDAYWEVRKVKLVKK